MERAQQRASTDGPANGPEAPANPLELLVHGVGGTTPQETLGDPRTVRITGDDTAAVFRRAEDIDAEDRTRDHRGGPVREAYVWCNLTSGNSARALWLLLLPFMVANLAHWMRPTARDSEHTVRLYGLLVRLVGLTLTVLLVAAACEVALDLAAWQCAGTRVCAERHTWLGLLSPQLSHDAWGSRPGRRLALAAVVPAALTGLLWYLSRRTWSAYESQQPLTHRPEPDEDTAHTSLSRPGFWYGRRLVARLRAAHTAAGLLTVAAAVASSALRFDHRADGPTALAVPDLTWRMATWTRATGGRLVIRPLPGQCAGRRGRLAADTVRPLDGSPCSPTAHRSSASTAAGSRPTSAPPRSAPCTARSTAGATSTG